MDFHHSYYLNLISMIYGQFRDYERINGINVIKSIKLFNFYISKYKLKYMSYNKINDTRRSFMGISF